MSEYLIQLRELTKRYPEQATPAVDGLSLDIPAGEIVVLAGPSGCGKTTSLKMINRLVEPTSGRIIIEGRDVTGVDPDRLRRGIGYVIREIGLFPHLTIGDNVATVPRLLGWDGPRVAQRIDELLAMVGLEPDTDRHRYPKELTAGQRQRVGLARALAADPPILLMDEPFTGIDPITGARLQNELRRLQEELHKTIVFATRDIDEAIKLGDRIAILREQAHVAQFATPEEILTQPADEFVEQVVGSGATLKRLRLSRVTDVDWRDDCPTGRLDDAPSVLRRRLAASDWTALLVLDDHGRPRRWLRTPDFRHERPVDRMGLPAVATVERQATLADALEEMLLGSVGVAIVVDGRGAYQGIIDVDVIIASIQQLREATSEFYRAAKLTDPAADRDAP